MIEIEGNMMNIKHDLTLFKKNQNNFANTLAVKCTRILRHKAHKGLYVWLQHKNIKRQCILKQT